MKEIFVARNELEACLIISEEFILLVKNLIERYNIYNMKSEDMFKKIKVLEKINETKPKLEKIKESEKKEEMRKAHKNYFKK